MSRDLPDELEYSLDRIATALERIGDRLGEMARVRRWTTVNDLTGGDGPREYLYDELSGEVIPTAESLLRQQRMREGRGLPVEVDRERDADRQPVGDVTESLDRAVSVQPVPAPSLEGGSDRTGGGDQVGVAHVQVQDGLGVVADEHGQAGHESSSRCAGADTPTERSVEDAADSAAGSAGGPLASGRPAAVTP